MLKLEDLEKQLEAEKKEPSKLSSAAERVRAQHQRRIEHLETAMRLVRC